MNAFKPYAIAVVAFLAPNLASAHDDHCAAVQASVDEAGFANSVSVTCDNDNAYLTSDTYPDHEMMTGITGSNEQVPVPGNWSAPVMLAPQYTGNPLTRDASIGVAVNGVPIYDYTAGGELSDSDLHTHQGHLDTVLTGQLDTCGGHAGRGDDYHYHTRPTCMIDAMDNKGDPAAIIGWGFDGFPIFRDTNPDGTAIAAGALDVCNGQPDDVFGYRYHTSADAPYIVQCLMGVVEDLDRVPRVRPLNMADGGLGPEAGRPPRGGVENLVFTQNDDGSRSMDYTYEGEAYYIRYAPSGTPNCYNYTTSTVTNGGEVFEGELCR
ncbi:YHYH protein [Yoonia sp. 208BN28-4]|uniref:YHYH protein n=1 Tax=Yoonia sp. 208BN28-4 TaxID=3126505 RepID=UPI0030A330D4